MVSLPPAEAAQISDDALNAYNVCLEFERDAKTDNDITHARVLGFLILHAPSPDALHEVIKVIHSCAQDHNALSELGQAFIEYFIRPFKKHKGPRTPASSDDSSRPSFDQDRIDLMAAIQEAPKDHKDAKTQALIRDGFKCVVTGKYDGEADKFSDISDEEFLRFGGAVHTECAHIVPASTYFDVSTTRTSSPEKKDWSASVLAILKRFGYDVESLNGPKVHSLFNVTTMQHDVHDWFDRLELWFEATGGNNSYHVKTAKGRYQVPREIITFTSPDPTNLPVPSAKLLALHAACAKVAHLSGAGEYIDKLDRDMDGLGVLGHDGGSFDILSHALLRAKVNIGA